MSRYTREELLHLRQSPIIVFHTPPLPEWISSDAIASSQARAVKSGERQSLTRNPRTTEDVGTVGFTRTVKTDKQDPSIPKNGRTIIERERNERSDDRQDRQLKKGDRERTDRLDTSTRQSRDSKKQEDSDSFGSRRMRKTDLPLSSRNSRRIEPTDDQPPRTGMSSRSAEPEWMTGTSSDVKEHDSGPGKTVDDFERWKQSMKKNDGSGDTGLPPLLTNEQEATPAIQDLRDDSAFKDVQPPPGFSAARGSSQDVKHDSVLLTDLFGSISTTEPKITDRMSAAHAADSNGSSSSPTTGSGGVSAAKGSGASKFSKFFGQSSGGSQTSERTAMQNRHDDISATSGNTSEFFSALTAPSKPGGNKDDAAGFERILAMLSSQSAPSSAKPSAQVPPQPRSGSQQQYHQQMHPDQTYSSQDIPRQIYGEAQSHQQQLLFSNSTDRSSRQHYASRETVDQHPRGAGIQSQQQRGLLSTSSPYERPYEHGPYSSDRSAIPAMRDGGVGPGSIMNHHTQNQDFFSSLLKQSQPAPGALQYGSNPSQDRLGASPPHTRHSPPSHRHQYDPREQSSRQPHRGPSGHDEQHLQYLRQQAGHMQHQPGTSAQRGRDPAELDFLNQLMAEQRMSSTQRDYAQYSSASQAPQNAGYGAQRQPSLPQGYLTGVGSQPGPGWNGQFEIDPRIPHGSQYRP